MAGNDILYEFITCIINRYLHKVGWKADPNVSNVLFLILAPQAHNEFYFSDYIGRYKSKDIIDQTVVKKRQLYLSKVALAALSAKSATKLEVGETKFAAEENMFDCHYINLDK